MLLTAIQQWAGWSTVFICCGISFAFAAACGLALDATKPVDAEDGGEAGLEVDSVRMIG